MTDEKKAEELQDDALDTAAGGAIDGDIKFSMHPGASSMLRPADTAHGSRTALRPADTAHGSRLTGIRAHKPFRFK